MRAASTIYELILGTALLFTPWSRVWQENWLFWRSGVLEPWLMSGPVKGAVSGLGAAFLLSAACRLIGLPMIDEGGGASGAGPGGAVPADVGTGDAEPGDIVPGDIVPGGVKPGGP